MCETLGTAETAVLELIPAAVNLNGFALDHTSGDTPQAAFRVVEGTSSPLFFFSVCPCWWWMMFFTRPAGYPYYSAGEERCAGAGGRRWRA
jgi:hypothetical protein